jgi:uncharacterized protein (DUF362 family)
VIESESAPQSPRGGWRWFRFVAPLVGILAAIWFLVRVIPKPSRATYPCQRAAFPIASSFVIWLLGAPSWVAGVRHLGRKLNGHRGLTLGVLAVSVSVPALWALDIMQENSQAGPVADITHWHWKPAAVNKPIGIARGINPGRVVWTRDPLATKWAGNWQQNSDQWWSENNTDQSRVDAMLSMTIQKLTSTASDEAAWQSLFNFYQKARGFEVKGYQSGEVVAVKINLNNSAANKTDNLIDASPHMVLAMVRQLVEKAHVAQKDIIVYDAQRDFYPAILTHVWNAYKDVRFLQHNPPAANQKLLGFGATPPLESPRWVAGVVYSANNSTYNQAKNIPQQIMDAKYIVNLALLKLHAYPAMPEYQYMEKGDDGQIALTMTGKNHFGSIQGTPELHAAINTMQDGKPGAYSPIVDLAACPNLGAKTVLYMLDGLYGGRRWKSYPIHLPNPPFNNRVEPYNNTDWPACVLASLDGVALDSVGLDIMNSQSKNNTFTDAKGNVIPRILIRENADDYLHDMAEPDKAPSGVVYKQDGKPITSLGTTEHWDSDATRRYSRNLDRAGGKGIELLFQPLNEPATAAPTGTMTNGQATLACADNNARIYFTLDGTTPTDHSTLYSTPVKVPAGAVLKAVAMTDDHRDSAVVTVGQ